MNDPTLVGVMQGIGNFRDDAHGLAGRKLAHLHPFAEVRAGDQVRDKVVVVTFPAVIVDADDIRMSQLGNSLGLVDKADTLEHGAMPLASQYFDRDEPVKSWIVGFPDLPKPTLADNFIEAIPAQRLGQLCPFPLGVLITGFRWIEQAVNPFQPADTLSQFGEQFGEIAT